MNYTVLPPVRLTRERCAECGSFQCTRWKCVGGGWRSADFACMCAHRLWRFPFSPVRRHGRQLQLRSTPHHRLPLAQLCPRPFALPLCSSPRPNRYCEHRRRLRRWMPPPSRPSRDLFSLALLWPSSRLICTLNHSTGLLWRSGCVPCVAIFAHQCRDG